MEVALLKCGTGLNIVLERKVIWFSLGLQDSPHPTYSGLAGNIRQTINTACLTCEGKLWRMDGVMQEGIQDAKLCVSSYFRSCQINLKQNFQD